jgi:Ca2+-binding EF-hand superfamily protein
MSWEIVLFSSEQNLVSLENLNEDLLKPIDFDKVLKSKFINIKKSENHNEIIGKDFSVEFFSDEELVSNKMLSVYGENGLFELIRIAKEENWQIYDSGIDKMLNLEKPEENGYGNFRQYLKNILSTK